MRNIIVEMPSGKAKMVLWECTEDEETFEVKSIKRGIPYVKAYGIKYDLTEEEIRHLRFMQKVIAGIKCDSK